MKQLAPQSEQPLAELIRGLPEYGNQAHQVGLAQEILYRLGVATAQNVPPLEEGESLPAYIDRLDPHDLAAIEALGIGQGQQLQEYFKTAARLILYQQYVTGRWVDYAVQLGVDRWSPYVSHLIDDCLQMSPSEGRRWAMAIEVIAHLYRPSSQDRYGLLYQGDLVIDNETGECEELAEGLPATAEEAVQDKFNRLSRQGGRVLRDLFREAQTLPLKNWDELNAYHEKGYLSDYAVAEEVLGWSEQTFEDHRKLYDRMCKIRKTLDLAASPLDDVKFNREASQSSTPLPPFVLPKDTPPVWVSVLTQQYPDSVSATGSLGMGQRYVQVRLIKWPTCPYCGNFMYIWPANPWCRDCARFDTDGRKFHSLWTVRIADEHGRYPQEWTKWGKRPSAWIEGLASEDMEIHGLRVSVWETAIALEELDE